MVEAFLTKYFPNLHFNLERRYFSLDNHGITLETLYDAWDHFRELFRKCPRHGYELWSQVQIFYNRMNYSTRILIDAACGDSITRKMAKETPQLFEELAKNNPKTS